MVNCVMEREAMDQAVRRALPFHLLCSQGKGVEEAVKGHGKAVRGRGKAVRGQ